MGILDKIFGSSPSTLDDKYVLYMSLAINLTAVDGEQSQDEIDELFKFFGSIPGMTESRYTRIHDRVTNEGNNALSHIDKLSEDDKLELVNFLIDIATADGHFHGEEFAYILMMGVMLGLDYNKLFDHLIENHEIDKDEFDLASERLKKQFKESGLMQ